MIVTNTTHVFKYEMFNDTTPEDISAAGLPAVDEFSKILEWRWAFLLTLSLYPQLYINWKRKSVVGLSFGFVAFDFFGIAALCVANITVLCISTATLQAELNEKLYVDLTTASTTSIVFSLHGLLVISMIIVQCIFYERDRQKVSEWVRVILVILTFIVLTPIIVSAVKSEQGIKDWTWLNTIMVFYHVKVAVTILKYWPQVFLNYRRKSTEGWSITGVWFNFVGGWLSLIQISILMGYQRCTNVDAIANTCISIITLVFSTVFIVQHYDLYNRKTESFMYYKQRTYKSTLVTEMANIQNEYNAKKPLL